MRASSVAASIGCSLFPGGFLFQNHYPRFRGAPSAFFKGCPQGRPSVDSGLASNGWYGRPEAEIRRASDWQGETRYDRMQHLREFNAAGPPTTANVIQRAAIGEAGQGATCSAAASAEAVRWPPGAAPARAEALGTGPGEKSREDARTATFWRTVGR